MTSTTYTNVKVIIDKKILIIVFFASLSVILKLFMTTKPASGYIKCIRINQCNVQ